MLQPDLCKQQSVQQSENIMNYLEIQLHCYEMIKKKMELISIKNYVQLKRCNKPREFNQNTGIYYALFKLYIHYTSKKSYPSLSRNRYIALKTNMMRPSRNFLLYNGTFFEIKVNEYINN